MLTAIATVFVRVTSIQMIEKKKTEKKNKTANLVLQAHTLACFQMQLTFKVKTVNSM